MLVSLQANPGTACVVYDEENGWYRGVVEGRMDEGRISVLAVDLGHRAEFSPIQLKPLYAPFATLPALSLRCRIYGTVVTTSAVAYLRKTSLCTVSKVRRKTENTYLCKVLADEANSSLTGEGAAEFHQVLDLVPDRLVVVYIYTFREPFAISVFDPRDLLQKLSTLQPDQMGAMGQKVCICKHSKYIPSLS